jgi:formate dehydrogenase (hydrogenase)
MMSVVREIAGRAYSCDLMEGGDGGMRKQLTRLTTPLVRENGELRRATWDEALDRAADGFRSAVAAGGPNAFGLFSCSKATNEVNFMTQKFARAVIGTNNVDSCNRT